MSADHQAAISRASSYGKATLRGVGELFPGRVEGPQRDVETEFGTKSTTALLLNGEKSDAVYSWKRPWANDSQPEVLLALGCPSLVLGGVCTDC